MTPQDQKDMQLGMALFFYDGILKALQDARDANDTLTENYIQVKLMPMVMKDIEPILNGADPQDVIRVRAKTQDNLIKQKQKEKDEGIDNPPFSMYLQFKEQAIRQNYKYTPPPPQKMANFKLPSSPISIPTPPISSIPIPPISIPTPPISIPTPPISIPTPPTPPTPPISIPTPPPISIPTPPTPPISIPTPPTPPISIPTPPTPPISTPKQIPQNLFDTNQQLYNSFTAYNIAYNNYSSCVERTYNSRTATYDSSYNASSNTFSSTTCNPASLNSSYNTLMSNISQANMDSSSMSNNGLTSIDDLKKNENNIKVLRSELDLKLQDLYSIQDSLPKMNQTSVDSTTFAFLLWTVLASSMVVYIFMPSSNTTTV
jgi:hypothetical protein